MSKLCWRIRSFFILLLAGKNCVILNAKFENGAALLSAPFNLVHGCEWKFVHPDRVGNL